MSYLDHKCIFIAGLLRWHYHIGRTVLSVGAVVRRSHSAKTYQVDRPEDSGQLHNRRTQRISSLLPCDTELKPRFNLCCRAIEVLSWLPKSVYSTPITVVVREICKEYTYK